MLTSVAALVLLATAPQRVPLPDRWSVAAERDPGQRPAAEAFRPAAVPGTFEEQLEPSFDGIAWYRRALPHRPEWQGRRVWLECPGAATVTEVFVNGERLAQHTGAWTPFRVALDGVARFDGSDRLELRVDEHVGHNTQGFLPVIQPHFGGLWRTPRLRVADDAVIDDFGLLLFGDGAANALRIEVPCVRGKAGAQLEVEVALWDGAQRVAVRREAVDGAAARFDLEVDAPRPWSPESPHLYRAVVRLFDAARQVELDALERRVGFRHLQADGRRVLWNGVPLQLRAVLHWGFSPPRYAPIRDRAAWRGELEYLRSLGFNAVKCCLWVPPRAFYELCDEIGMLVWQEYPTWHADLTAPQRAALGAEFDEFFAHDRSHPSVAFRSLTCETGADVDHEVLRELYERCHERVPNTLVNDNSAWISWSVTHDFYDDHPYGNNRWWAGKLAELDAYIDEHGDKPLLLGECIASDTWFDAEAWRREAPADAWWAPWCLPAQPAFEEWVERHFGPRARRALVAESRDYAMRNRKLQIERLRLAVPDAGYVVSVVRDFPLARMGLLDDLGRPKWSAAEWAWHGATMVALDLPEEQRAFFEGEVELPLRVAHHGRRPLRATLAVRVDGEPGGLRELGTLQLQPGEVSETKVVRLRLRATNGPRRVRLRAMWGSHATNAWDLWVLPAVPPAPAAPVHVTEALDAAAWAVLDAGGRVLHRAAGGSHSLRSKTTWFLRGAAIASPPPALARHVPAALLRELQTADLETGRVLDVAPLHDGLAPLLSVWDTHDRRDVGFHPLVAETRVGDGRLLVSTLDWRTDAGRYVERCLAAYLTASAPPSAALTAVQVDGLRAEAVAESVEVPEWELRLDPDDRGMADGWAGGTAPEDGWRAVRAGAHWESQGFEGADGIGWYRTTVELPAAWQGQPISAVLDGVDDSYRLFLNGTELGRHGDPDTGETVWLVRTAVELTPAVRWDGPNQLVLRVVDHQGAGGLWKPVRITNTPPAATQDLLH